jgi:hypothetical protein
VTKKRKSLQVIYETNSDYQSTKKAESPGVYIYEDENNPTGRFTINFFYKTYSPVILYNTGALQITFHSNKEHDEIYEKIQKVLVPNKGEKLRIFNKTIVDHKIVHQLEVIDIKIELLHFYERRLQEPSPFGQVWTRNERGELEHPLKKGIDSEKDKLNTARNNLFPSYCEGPFQNIEFCKQCNPKKHSIQSNFAKHYRVDCFLYESNKCQVIADSNGVGAIFRYLANELSFLIPVVSKGLSSVSFLKPNSDRRKKEPIIVISPSESNPKDGLCWRLFENRFKSFFYISDFSLKAYLPPDSIPWVYGSQSTQQRNKKEGMEKEGFGYTGYFQLDEAKKFINKLRSHYF